MTPESTHLLTSLAVFLILTVVFVGIAFAVLVRPRGGKKERIYQLTTFLVALICIAAGTILLAVEEKYPFLKTLGPLTLVLWQFGGTILLIELFNHDYLLEIKIPRTIFRHGYIEIASRKEVEILLEDIVRAFTELEKIEFQGELLQTYFGAVRSFIHDTFRAPLRIEYQGVIRLYDDKFREIILTDSKAEENIHEDLLSIALTYEYSTETNQSKRSLKINETGIIHRVDDIVPACTWLYKEFKYAEGRISPLIIQRWIKNNLKPKVKVLINGESKELDGIVPNDKINLGWDKNGQLRIVFPIYNDIEIPIGTSAKVIYTQFIMGETADKHHWVAFSRTNGFSFRHEGFEQKGYRLVPIAEATFWSRIPGVQDRGCLPSIGNDRIELPGLVFPGSVFGFFWYPAKPNQGHENRTNRSRNQVKKRSR